MGVWKMAKWFLVLVAAIGASLLLAACGGAPSGGGSGSGGSGGGPKAESCDLENPPLFEDGKLTVATDKPAYPPWFEGDPENYSGYEGEVANEIAKRMDLDIEWVVVPFNQSYAPGAKDFDFDINQITITEEREQAVDFSEGYFDNAQGILALKSSPAADAETIGDLKDDQLGAQVGTTSLDFINETIQPEQEVKVFDTTNDVKSALEGGRIDAFATDLVTTVYLRDFEIEGSEVIGQFPRNEEFGMVFEEGNPLVGCVNEVLGEMKNDGTLEDLQKEFLQAYLSVPVIKE
jgi:polar amino acid transport system substrate-binding protein